MAVNDVFRVEVFQNIGSEQTLNVIHFREATVETVLANPAENAVTAAHGMFLALAPDMPEGWRVVQITGRKVSPASGIPFTRVLGAADAIEGELTSGICPPQAAILVSFYSFNTLRTGRGRIFIPGVAETIQEEGQLNEASVTNLQTWADAWFIDALGPFAPGDGTVWPTIFGPTTTPGTPQDIIQATVRPNLATQKRRRAFPGFGA